MKLASAISFWICVGATFGLDNRIIGGRPAKLGEFPYQVRKNSRELYTVMGKCVEPSKYLWNYLRYQNEVWEVSIKIKHDGSHICGGTIISPRFVLSASHCFQSNLPSDYMVIAGQLTHPITDSSICRNVSRIIQHGFSFWVVNDIALLELETNLPLNNTLISTVALNKEIIKSGTCIVTGWGFLERDGPLISEYLMAAEVYIINNRRCRKNYILLPLPGMICAGHPRGTTDSCSGDSGGPLVCNGLLVGIVSGGRVCGCAKYPGIYTNVVFYLSWIETKTSIRFS